MAARAVGNRSMLMGYMITFVVCLTGAIFAMVAVGFFLPRDHIAAGSENFTADPEKLFDLAVELQTASDVKTRVTEEVRPKRRVTEIIEGKGAAFGGTWTLEIETADEGRTRLKITERGKVYNPLFRFLSKFVFGHHATIETFLKTLRQRAERP